MTFRPMLLSAVVALGLAAGCSKPPSPSMQPSSEPGAAPVTDTQQQPESDAKPTETAPAAGEPGTAAAPTTGGAEMKKGETAVYIVKNSGVRCITTPCPYFTAVRADKPNEDAIQVHELDLSAVTAGSEDRQQDLLRKTEDGVGLKVEASLDTRPNAGPAGAATVLRASKLVGG